MDQLTQAFAREKIRRAIQKCDSKVELRAICERLIECNEHLRAMLVEKIEQELD